MRTPRVSFGKPAFTPSIAVDAAVLELRTWRQPGAIPLLLLGLFFVLRPIGASAQPATWSISTDEVELGAGQDELFESVRYGLLLPDGGAVVADAAALFIRVYGPGGARQTTFGRRGGGPGEFEAIHGIWLTPAGDIGVWDGSLRRFTILDRTGSVLATAPVRGEGELVGNLEVFLGAFSNGDVLLAALRFGQADGGSASPDRWSLGRFTSSGELRATSGELNGMVRFGRGPLPFSPVPRAAIRMDSLWVSHGYGPTIEVRADGDVARTITVQWTPAPAENPRTMLQAELEDRDNRFLLELLAEMPTSESYPHVGGMLDDSEGNVWVKQYEARTDALWLQRNALAIPTGGIWHVLRGDGEPIATLRIPANLVPLDIRDERILAVERDELDVERVVVRRIVR